MTSRISVIVLNYNGKRWLDPCLTALAAQTGAPPFDVILADNGSADGSVDLVASAFPSVQIVRHGRNLGFAAGNNAAVKASTGSILVFLNNDTIPAPDWLARLHAAFAGQPQDTLVTSRIVFLENPEIVDSAGDGYLRAGGAYKRAHGRRAQDVVESCEVFGACGAAFMISRAQFERLGGFDERFFMVYEDVDLSYRARLSGGRCWYAADACVRHAGSGTLGVVSAAAVRYGQRNLEWTWLKNTPGPLLARTFVTHAAYSIAGVAHYVLKGQGVAAVAGKLAAVAGLPRVLSERRAIQRRRSADPRLLERWMDDGWLSLKRREKSARESAAR